MIAPVSDLPAAVADTVARYRASGDIRDLLERLAALCDRATPEDLAAAVEPFRDIPEVAGPVYERIVAARPDDAKALVILANAYWLAGRGPETVGDLATRALAADPTHRGAWHLWALTSPTPRERVTRWQRVIQRFPDDDLARASLADNATSLAGAENDPVALKLAIATYEALWARASAPAQREALEQALTTLRGWKV